jgi:hypothetical protein
MATLVLTRPGNTRPNPTNDARPIGSLETTDTATWAEVTGNMLDAANATVPFAIPAGGCVANVTVAAATRCWVGTAAPPAGVAGWLLPANTSLNLKVHLGDRIWFRTA